MKMVILPGVGFNKQVQVYNHFIDEIKKQVDIEIQFFTWSHKYDIPEINLPYAGVREFVCEVILDFQQVVKHALDTEVPDADIYIGHSAGSVIAMAQKNKPAIIMGSPSILVEAIRDIYDIHQSDEVIENIVTNDGKRPILNIINKYDMLAYPLLFDSINIENYIYSGSAINPCTYIPLNAHIDYWRNEKIVNKISDTIKNWQKTSKIL